MVPQEAEEAAAEEQGERVPGLTAEEPEGAEGGAVEGIDAEEPPEETLERARFREDAEEEVVTGVANSSSQRIVEADVVAA